MIDTPSFQAASRDIFYEITIRAMDGCSRITHVDLLIYFWQYRSALNVAISMSEWEKADETWREEKNNKIIISMRGSFGEDVLK